MTVLEMIAVAGRSVTVAEVQKATKLPRPTCYRLLQTLADQRLLDDPEKNAQYVIGDRLIRIALSGKSDIDVRHACAPVLKAATVKLGETVFLARFRHRHVEIIHVEIPTDTTHGFIHPGLGARPMHACSCSKAIAAFARDTFQKEILSGSLKGYTEHTKTTAKALRSEFARIVDQGYAECDQEIEIGVSSVAAPVQIAHIGASFSIGAVGPVRRFNSAYRHALGEELKQFSTKISAAIQLYGDSEFQDSDLALIHPGKEKGNETIRKH